MRVALLAFLALILAACSAPSWLSAHKIEVQQGNFVSQDMVAKLKPGMSKSQVRFALGTPLLTDPFHQDRWDYVYVMQRGGKVREKRTVTVVFVDDKLHRVEGDVVAAAPGAEAAAAAISRNGAAAPGQDTEKAAEPSPAASQPPGQQ